MSLSISSIVLVITIASLATLTIPSTAQDSPQDYVNAHNAARSAVGVGPVTWDPSVAAYAQSYANQRAAGDCGLVHSGGPYGENIAWSSGQLVIWRSSSRIGCAKAACSGGRGTFVICNYNPPGNYVGQKPY
ncbi:Pathogenesis-related protein 1 [Linum perenne]